MESIRNRAKDRFPMVLLTLLSIVQALALELLWEHLHDRPDLYEVSWTSFIGWLQVVASLNGIVLIWLAYTGIVMRVRWTPSTGDSILPFFIGLIEFLMIDMMGPHKLGQWLIVLAIIFATMITISHQIMRRSRLDPSNDEFFANFAPAKKRDFLPQGIVIGSMIVFGGWLWFSGYQNWLALVALAGALTALVYETYSASRYWTRSMRE